MNIFLKYSFAEYQKNVLVVPVSCAIMTPLPLAVLYVVKLVLDRRKTKLASSNEKLQNPQTTTPNSSSRLNQSTEDGNFTRIT